MPVPYTAKPQSDYSFSVSKWLVTLLLPQAPAAAGSSGGRVNLTHQMSSSNAKKAVGALTSAAAAAAASCGGKGSSSSSSAGPSTGSGTAGGPRMFDVGSAGGYYTEKSPKLMLHEWCTQQKRPKPKYKAIAIDPERGGGFRCACWGC
jgi:hypothetical protein